MMHKKKLLFTGSSKEINIQGRSPSSFFVVASNSKNSEMLRIIWLNVMGNTIAKSNMYCMGLKGMVSG